MLKIVCAWCGKVMGYKEGGDGITHGMCADCYAAMEREIEEMEIEAFSEEESE
jgi:hypothetical protein